MTPAYLVLCRIALSVLSVLLRKGHRQLLVLAHLIDAGLIGMLFVRLYTVGECECVLGPWTAATSIAFSVDRIGLTFVSLAFALSVAVTLYTWRDALKPYAFLLLNLLVGACYALSFTKDLFNAYVLFELITLSSFLLVGYDRKPCQIWASLRYLILSSFGMTIFLFGIAVAYYHAGTLHLDALASAVAANPSSPWITLSAALLVTGVSVKAGVFVFSLWLPSAHAEAPPAVSALLSGLVIKMGVVELFRLSGVFPLETTLLVLGFVTAFLGLVYAVRTKHIKRMLAFHTLSQIGYLLIGFGAGTESARVGALDYAVAHGLFKGLLFLVVGEIATLAGSDDLDQLVQHRDRFPRACRWMLIVACLGILGLPPFAGFAAKAVLEAGIHSTLVHALVALVSVGTAASFAKLVPLLSRPFGGPRCAVPRAVGYGWLGAAILFFLPLSRLLVPQPIWLTTFNALAFVEALAAVLLGFAVYRLLQHVPWRLPRNIFRIEEALTAVLAGFILVWSLLAAA